MNSTMPKAAPSAGKAPFRPIFYAEPRVIREDRADGSIVLRSAHALKPYEPSLVALFRKRGRARAGPPVHRRARRLRRLGAG